MTVAIYMCTMYQNHEFKPLMVRYDHPVALILEDLPSPRDLCLSSDWSLRWKVRGIQQLQYLCYCRIKSATPPPLKSVWEAKMCPLIPLF